MRTTFTFWHHHITEEVLGGWNTPVHCHNHHHYHYHRPGSVVGFRITITITIIIVIILIMMSTWWRRKCWRVGMQAWELRRWRQAWVGQQNISTYHLHLNLWSSSSWGFLWGFPYSETESTAQQCANDDNNFFHRSNLWTVMGCGIARIGHQRGL